MEKSNRPLDQMRSRLHRYWMFKIIAAFFGVFFLVLSTYVYGSHILAADELAGDSLAAVATMMGVAGALAAAWIAASPVRRQLDEMKRQSAAAALQALRPIAQAAAEETSALGRLGQLRAACESAVRSAKQGQTFTTDAIRDVQEQIRDAYVSVDTFWLKVPEDAPENNLRRQVLDSLDELRPLADFLFHLTCVRRRPMPLASEIIEMRGAIDEFETAFLEFHKCAKEYAAQVNRSRNATNDRIAELSRIALGEK